MEEEFGPTPSKQIKEENIKRGISPWHATLTGPRAQLCKGWVVLSGRTHPESESVPPLLGFLTWE